MAVNSQTIFQNVRKPCEDPTPTSANIINITRHNDNDKDRKTASLRQPLSGKIGQLGDRGVLQPTGRASESDLKRLSHAQNENHATTPAIDVPRPATAEGSRWTSRNCLSSQIMDEDLYQTVSPLEEYMRTRKTSISFNPHITLDSGHRRDLEAPLPKLITVSRLENRSDSQETFDDATEDFPKLTLLRSNSEAEISNYDPVTGELKTTSPFDESAEFERPRYILSPTLPRDIEPRRGSITTENSTSLTSDSTSPPLEEIKTPTDNMDILLSPISGPLSAPVSPFPIFHYPTSLEDSSAWPKPRRQQPAGRARSYNPERAFSMHSAQRQRSRHSSGRTNSSSMSPATAFLSRFARDESPPEPDSEGQEVGEYVLGKQVGFGGFSTVKEAYTLEGDERICRAVKVVRKHLMGKDEIENERLQEEFEHEVGLWRCLGHRNILPLIEVIDSSFATFCFTKLNTGGTLFDIVRANRQGISRDLARRYAYQLASAIRYLHEDVRIVHRDIKLENCLVDISDPDSAKDGGNVLLCDFGLAQFASSNTESSSGQSYLQATDFSSSQMTGTSDTSTTIAGSLQYASPELIKSPAALLDPVVDVWAYGVVIYALLVGDLPFQHVFQPRVQMMILAGEWSAEVLEKANGVVGYEDEALEFMHGCFDMESENRWTISQILGSRWLRGCQEMLEEFNGSWRL